MPFPAAIPIRWPALTPASVEFDRFMKSKAPSSYTRADFKGFKKHLEERGNSPRTVGKKIGFLSTILNYAVQDEKLTANPATGLLKATPGASKKTRIPYSAKDVQNILGSKIYAAGARPAAGGGEAVVWLPLLGLLTGGRLEELAQLRVDDVGFVDGLGTTCTSPTATTSSMSRPTSRGAGCQCTLTC